MHAEMRRVPAERARHAKRLGHVQVGSGSSFQMLAAAVNGTTTTTQQSATPATTASSQSAPATSATHSSSSAPTSSSTTPSSPATTPSTSSASPATTQSLPPSVSSSQMTSLAAPVSASPTSPTSTPQTNTAAATSSGLSGGAIAGIIAGAVIVGAALIVFFVRKTYLRRRGRKHISWNGPGLGAGFLDEPKPFPEISEQAASSPQRSVPLSPFEVHGQSMYSTPVPPVVHMHPATFPAYSIPTPPPATYNNPTQVAAYPTHPVPSTYSPGNATALAMPRAGTGIHISSTLPSVRAHHAPLEAMVKCTFVPTLPDELSITTGERIFVVEQYDDGWDLCANGRGERGMVPRECLEHAPIDQPDIGWSNVRRTSSLNPDGQRF